MEEFKGGQDGEGGGGGGGPQQQRGKGKRRFVDAGLALLPDEEEDDASPASSTGARVGGGAASNAVPAGRRENPLDKSEIMTNLASFFDDNAYLFMGGVSRCWNKAWQWQRLPTKTCGISAMTTTGQLQHSFACGLERSSSVCVAAARLKKLNLLQVARDAGCPWDVDVAVWLVRGGLTNELKKACSGEGACSLGEKVLDAAAEGSRWGLMRWLFGQGCPCSPRTMAAIAANAGRKGNVGPDALLQLARNAGAPLDVATSVSLARRGLKETLLWAVEEGCQINETTAAAAAEGGHLDVLVCLRSQNCPWDVETCKKAAFGGHLDVLQYARKNGCPWNNYTCAMAAAGGHIYVLDWLRQNRCFWKPSTCHQAAKAGQLGALKWAREGGCPWGPSTFYEAAKAGHWPILEYLTSAEAEEDRCPWNERLCQGCAEGGHLAILKWARSAGCPWNEDTIARFAAINGHLDFLQYAWDQGCAVKADLKTDPAVNRHAHVRRWLRDLDRAQAEKIKEAEEGQAVS